MIDSQTFAKAISFAVKAHEGQVRKGDGRPYILHPISVMMRISSIKKSKNIYLLGAAAVLHDTVEDCGIELEWIAREFGYHVAALVKELTLDKDLYAKYGKTGTLIREMDKMSSYGLAIKLADRLDNVSDLGTMDNKFQKYYVQQTEKILESLDQSKLTKTHKKLIKLIEKEIHKYEKYLRNPIHTHQHPNAPESK